MPQSQDARAHPADAGEQTAAFPVYFSPLVGRRREQRLLRRLLQDPRVRLLTLTGPGGVGKTRLAAEMAQQMAGEFVGGQYFVDLTPVRDPKLVLPTIAQTMGLRRGDGTPPAERLASKLNGRGTAFLVLDNFEQVVSAAPAVRQLLAEVPTLKIVVTSREVLRVRDEHEVRVPPLAVPELSRMRPTAVHLVEALSRKEAVALFLQSARQVRVGYEPDTEEIIAISRICAHLDGLPLALELAAARLRLFSPQVLLKRIEAHAGKFLPLLRDDRRDRHQGLWQTIAWSYDLLPPQEQRLFASLSVFEGAFELSAAEHVVRQPLPDGASWPDIAGGVASLVEKSLLRAETGDSEARFSMLATLRDFARGQLEPSTAHKLQAAHAAYYLNLAETAAPHLAGSDQQAWLDRLERAYPNLRAGLQWAAAADHETALPLARALWRFWLLGGYRLEGMRLLETVLDNTADVSTRPLQRQRGHVLCGAVMIAHYLADYERALPLAEAAVATLRRAGDAPGLAVALGYQGRVLAASGDLVAARRVLQEAERRQREQGAGPELAQTLHGLGRVAVTLGHYEQAHHYASEALAIYRQRGDVWGTVGEIFFTSAICLIEGDYGAASALVAEGQALLDPIAQDAVVPRAVTMKGLIALAEGELERSEKLFQEALDAIRTDRDRRSMAMVKMGLGDLALQRGDVQTARSRLRQALSVNLEIRDLLAIAGILERLAETAVTAQDFAAAAHYLGAAASVRHTSGAAVPPRRRATLGEITRRVQEALPRPELEQAWQRGPALHLSQLSGRWQPAPPPKKEPALDLTPRQIDVLRLVAQGLTDKEVADELVLSPRTVQGHLRNIYGRLGVNSRTAASRIALEAGLVTL